MGSIYFWVLNGKGDRASAVKEQGEIKYISRGKGTKLHWQVSFMLHLFHRLPYFCLADILHILLMMPCNNLASNRLLFGISPNLIRYLPKPRE